MCIRDRLLGARATKLALSLYEAPDLPDKRIIVGPPILRKQLFGLQPNPNGDFTLVYLLNHGYAGRSSSGAMRIRKPDCIASTTSPVRRPNFNIRPRSRFI